MTRYLPNIRQGENGFPEHAFESDAGIKHGASLIDKVIEHIVTDKEPDKLESLTVADPYRTVILMDHYLNRISNDDVNNKPNTKGRKALSDDAYSNSITDQALAALRDMLKIIAMGEDRISYEDVSLQTLPAELAPLRDLVPELTPIVYGRQFTKESSIRCIFFDGVCFAIASPYSLLAPVFHGLKTIKVDKVGGHIENGNAYVAAFASQLIARLKSAADAPDKEVQNKNDKYRTILSAFCEDLGCPVPSNGAVCLAEPDYSAACDMVFQDPADATGFKTVGGNPYVPCGNGTLRRMCWFDSNGKKNIVQVDVKAVGNIPSWTKAYDYVGSDFVFANGGMPRFDCANGARIVDGSYQYEVNASDVIVSARIRIPVDDNNGEVEEEIRRAVPKADLLSRYFAPSACAFKAEKTSNTLLPESFFSLYNGTKYFIPKPAAPALCDSTTIQILRAESSMVSFTATIDLGGFELSKKYSAQLGIEGEMSDFAVWPAKMIPGFDKYYLFNAIGMKGFIVSEIDVRKYLAEEAITAMTENDFDHGINTVPLTSFPEKLGVFTRDGEYCGCIDIDVQDAIPVRPGSKITYAPDFGTSNTTIFSDGTEAPYKDFNDGNVLASRAYTNRNKPLIDSFFIPCSVEESKESFVTPEVVIARTFRTLLYMRKNGSVALNMLKDYSVYFNSETRRDTSVTDLIEARSGSWELRSDLKASELETAQYFLGQLIFMMAVDARLRGFETIKAIEFTYPLAFSHEQQSQIDTAISAAVTTLPNNFLGYDLTAGGNVGRTRSIDESTAGIVFCKVSAPTFTGNNGINDIGRGKSKIIMCDIGGGTTDISTAAATSAGGQQIFTGARTTSIKLGARKVFINFLYKDMKKRDSAEGSLLQSMVKALGLKAGAYTADLNKLAVLARAGDEKGFVTHFEYMLCVKENKTSLGAELSKLATAGKLGQNDQTDDNLIRLRSVLSLYLLYIAYSAGLLLYNANNAQKIANTVAFVLAGNGSHIFDLVDSVLKNTLVYYGLMLGATGTHEPLNGNAPQVLYVNSNYAAHIKTEVSRGALDAIKLKNSPNAPAVDPEFIVPSEAEFSIDPDILPCGQADPKKGNYRDLYAADYFFGKRELPVDKNGQWTLYQLISAYNTCASNTQLIYGIRIQDTDNNISFIDNQPGNVEAVIDISSLEDGANMRFGKLSESSNDYPDLSDVANAVRNHEANGNMAGIREVLSNADFANYKSCERVDPMRFIIEEICSQISLAV